MTKFSVSVPFTDYIDFLRKAGIPKLNKVQSLVDRPPYHPSFDFYKALREALIDHLKSGKSKKDLYHFLSLVSDSKKISRYTSLVRGYFKFLGRKKANWFEPPSPIWVHKDLNVKINPEFGIEFGGERYLIKLYFKEEPLLKKDVQITLSMMTETLSTGIYTGYICALLDVERGRLHYSKAPDKRIRSLIEGEAESFLRIWEGLTKKSA